MDVLYLSRLNLCLNLCRKRKDTVLTRVVVYDFPDYLVVGLLVISSLQWVGIES